MRKEKILRMKSRVCPGPIFNESTIIASTKVQFYKHLLGDYTVQGQIPGLSFTCCITLGN